MSLSRRRALSLASLYLATLASSLIPTAGEARSNADALSTWGLFKPYVVYGSDDRHEICEETDADRLRVANSVVALIEKKALKRATDGSYTIRTESYKDSYGLCPTERFVDQRVAAVCTGFLIGPDLVATAGHCVLDERSCLETKFVFDFKIDKRGALPDKVGADQVYGCKELLASSTQDGGRDFALLRLDRVVVGNRSALKIRQSGSIDKGQEIFVVGHPAGLPAKIASGAQVRSNEGSFFIANLDVYEGNSGSPVFNAQTLEVEGILVAGEEDFVRNGKCYVTNRCSDTGCRGEEVTAISALLPYLKPPAPSLIRLGSK